MSLPLYIVDAFTTSPFSGNPAAVCLVGDRDVAEDAMQSLASEMNLSETAYVKFAKGCSVSFKDGDRFALRWFTPKNEVCLCGHATLAAAAVLFFECGNTNDEIVFTTLSGELRVVKEKDELTMEFPNNNPVEVDRVEDFLPIMEAVLGKAVSDVETVLLSTATKKLVLVMGGSHTNDRLKSISPDFGKMLSEHNGSRVAGVVVTAKGDSDYHFFSRYFAPWVGISEDPVTGSAHTVLGPYWSSVLDTSSLKARQCSKRGGDVYVRVTDESVDLTGSAVTVVRGNIELLL